MSPRRASEFVKAWAEHRRSGGKLKQGEFAKVWRDMLSIKTVTPEAVQPAPTPEVTSEPEAF